MFKWGWRPRHWRELLADVKLYRDGHRRSAPYGTRGRTHVKIGEDTGTSMVVRREPTGTITPSRVYCAEEGKWYSVDDWQARNKED